MSSAVDRLSEFLAEEAQPREVFQLETKDQAIWALRKLQKINAEEEAVNAAANREFERIAKWQEQEHLALNQDKSFFEGLLREYHQKQLAENPKAKTLKFAGFGNLKSKAQQPKLTYSEEILKAWAEKNAPEFVITPPPVVPEPKLAWGELKKKLEFKNGQAIFTDTGEIVNEIVVTEQDRKFEVELEVQCEQI